MAKTRSRKRQVDVDEETKTTKERKEDSSSSSVEEDAAEVDRSDGESDSSPEDVSFSQSKQEVMNTVSAALKQVQENKKKLKEKRRKHHELLTEQKEKKLERLKSKKLPEDFLREVSQTSIPSPPAASKVDNTKKIHQHFDEDDDVEAGSGEEESTPIADRFYVVTAHRAEKRPHPKPDKALEFLQQSLYGRGVKRMSVTNIIDYNAKKEGLPGRHFINAKGRRNRRKHGRRQVSAT